MTYVIRVRDGQQWTTARFSGQTYTFLHPKAAQEFIQGHWQGFGVDWKRDNLRVESQ